MSFIEDPYILIADLITSATHNESLVDLLLSMFDEYSLKCALQKQKLRKHDIKHGMFLNPSQFRV